MAPPCKFYQQGNCRYGASCRFEHPGANTNSNPFGAPSANRFNALNNTSLRPGDDTNPYKITKEAIKTDLASERPTWILSCYGPGKDAPEQLFGGYPREQSLEEVMVHIRGSANPQQAMAEVTALHQQAEQQIQTTLGNLDGAVQFVLAGANKHPNRIDICKQNTMGGGTTGIFAVKTGFADNPLASNTSANQNPFSTTTQSNPFSGGAPAFGQPSTLGRPANPFGASTTPAFGQPSQMGASVPAFGQPSQMGASAPAFGQPSQIGASTPAFGQPSQMGASAPAFGQPSQIGASAPAFGKPSTLGQGASPFAAVSNMGPSPFAQTGQSSGAQPSPFGAASNPAPNPFGQPSGSASGASPFAAVTGGAASSTSPFGQPAASNPFSQGTTSNANAMDTSAPEPTPNNPFGQPSLPSISSMGQTGSPFGQPAPNTGSGANPFGQATAQNQAAPAANKSGPYAPGGTKQHPPPESYITKAMNGQITAFKNQPVVYKWKVNDRYQDQAPPDASMDQQIAGFRGPDGTWCKILFPGGPPAYNKDTEPDPARYDASVKAAYEQMAATGRFPGGIMPEVPPMREDCIWSL